MPNPRSIPAPASASNDAAVLALTRPHPHLLFLYSAYSLAGLVLAPAVFLPLYFKYHTLRYRLDEQGISASWGILFRREIHLTYKRIQDIHVKRNLLERWLGIASVEIQTASGSSSAELALEGMADWEGVRDFLYRRMRGYEIGPTTGAAGPSAAREEEDEVVRLLREIRAEVEGARRALEARS
jgi:uncharacterized protein